jgi:hypothetical protein
MGVGFVHDHECFGEGCWLFNGTKEYIRGPKSRWENSSQKKTCVLVVDLRAAVGMSLMYLYETKF